MHNGFLLLLLGAALISLSLAAASAAPVKIEKVDYSIYGSCYKLTNGVVDALVTTDLGPRVIFYGFSGETNMLAELGPEAVEKTDLGEWHPWGGHRLWAAPESMPRTYWPDNDPIKAEKLGSDAVKVIPAAEDKTGLQKDMTIKLDADGTCLTITHKITNIGLWPIELAPWALTIMNGGGTTIFPQEPFIPHGEELLPARPLTLWHYTDMTDSRWVFGKKLVMLSTDEKLEHPQKVGAANKRGWAGYLRDKTLFVKRFLYVDGADYPDYGCNFETYTAGTFMEIETLGPLTELEPGKSVTHVERWYLFADVDGGASEDSMEAAVMPLVNKTQGF